MSKGSCTGDSGPSWTDGRRAYAHPGGHLSPRWFGYLSIRFVVILLGIGTLLPLEGPLADCSVLMEPTRSLGPEPALGLVFTVADDSTITLSVRKGDGVGAVQVVAGDRRLAFEPMDAPDPLALFQQMPWLSLHGEQPVHLTAPVAGGDYVTSRYNRLSGLDVLTRIAESCGETLMLPADASDCDAGLINAYHAGLSLSRSHLDACLAEQKELGSAADSCVASGFGNADRELADSVLALQRRLLPELAEPASSAAAVATIQSALLLHWMQRRLAGLRAERQALEERLMPRAPRRHEGLIPAANLAQFVEALLLPQECDDVQARVDINGVLTLVGTAATRASLQAMRDRYRILTAVFDDAEFQIALLPGGACVARLGEHWVLVPDASGRIEQVGYRMAVASREDLPRLADLEPLSDAARPHARLGPFFKRGQTPLVWCRHGGKVGICRRGGWSDDWHFQSGDGTTYAAFLILMQTRS
jgi:hypothetical protein